MMLGLLLARAGVDATLRIADFSRLPTRCGYIAFMPQWDFLSFLAERAARSATFALRMGTEVTGLIEQSGRVVGVRARGAEDPLELRADLVVAADGRHSRLRDEAGLEVQNLGAPMDVLWFRLPRRPGDPPQTMGRFDAGRIFILINRGDYWQSGYVIAKGTIEQVREAGLAAFREGVAKAAPFARDRVSGIGWDDVKLLTVRVNRLRRWHRPGLLCIGDAAPVGGVGINLAIADAVAAANANALATPLREGRVSGWWAAPSGSASAPSTSPNVPSAALDLERPPPVLAQARLGVLGAHRPLLAVGDSGDALLGHAIGGQVLGHRPGAPLAEREVVLGGAPLVAVPFD